MRDKNRKTILTPGDFESCENGFSIFYYSIGGREVTTREPIQSHDFIEVHSATKTRIIEKCAPLYEQGLSLRDIEERTGIAKSTIIETLMKSGMALRNPLDGNAKKIDNKRTKRGGHTAFGYSRYKIRRWI